jgi:preprotein translocase subunit SecB
MSDTSGNGATNGNGNADTGQAFVLQQIYLKDLSFEAPNSPEIFQQQQAEPETELNIRNEHKALDNNHFEVVLNISIHAKVDDKTIFLIELQQAGIFAISGFAKEQIAILLGTQCPSTLFPYARETIATQVGKGGFPPLVLQPINFDSLYAQAQAKTPQELQS